MVFVPASMSCSGLMRSVPVFLYSSISSVVARTVAVLSSPISAISMTSRVLVELFNNVAVSRQFAMVGDASIDSRISRSISCCCDMLLLS